MGGRLPATTRANTRTSTDAAPARSNAREQASTVAPEVSTSSTSTSFRPATSALPWAGTRKAPWTLWARRLGDDLGQQCRLVEPTRPLSAPVQRYRNDGVAVSKQLAAGTRHPASHGRGEVEPVAVFQGMDELARDIVVAHRRAGAVVGWRIGDRFHRQEAWPAIEGERNAEPLAIGRRDEGELGPASRTQTRAVDRLATGRAKLRQRDVNHESEARA